MNDRINYSGLVELLVQNNDEVEPNLRDWPTARIDPTSQPQTEPHHSTAASQEE